MTVRQFVASIFLLASVTSAWAAQPPASSPAVNDTYPNLASGALCYANLGRLPKDQILNSGKLAITQKDLNAEMAKAPEEMRTQLEKNRFFLLEQVATRRLLLQEARQKDPASQPASAEGEIDIIQKYLDQQAKDIDVSDAEVKTFYEQNKEMCGGMPLTQVQDELKQFVFKQKKQERLDQFIRTLGQRTPIMVAADWTKEQATSAFDNPVDKFRRSGKPSLVDFGATGCVPCDMLAPILENLTKKYEGKMNVQFIHVREQPVLAARYGIQSIPVQVIFDKDGKEVFRHTGFIPQEELEKQIAAQGVK